jgi:hypothetical protein
MSFQVIKKTPIFFRDAVTRYSNQPAANDELLVKNNI